MLRQVTFWTLIKTRRWEWLEGLFDAQSGRKLTLSALLAFSRSLHEEKGVQRRHLRVAGGRRKGGVARRDARSKRLLPAELVEGKEVEALFMKVLKTNNKYVLLVGAVVQHKGGRTRG